MPSGQGVSRKYNKQRTQTGTTTPPVRRASGLVAVLCLLVGAAVASARAGEPLSPGDSALIVLSSNAQPYRQCAQTISKGLAKHKIRSRVVVLSVRPDADVTDKADLYVAIGSRATARLHRSLSADAHLLYCMVQHPEATGLARGPARYGVTTRVPVSRQFELIGRALPRARSVGMLYRGKQPTSVATKQEAARSLPKGWKLEAVDVDKHSSEAEAIRSLFSRSVDVVWTSADPTVYNVGVARAMLLEGLRNRMPVFGFSHAFVRAGALFGIGVDPSDQGSQVVELVARHYTKPASGATPKEPTSKTADSLPGRYTPEPARCHLSVNLLVARKIGVTLPPKVLQSASFVFGAKDEGQ